MAWMSQLRQQRRFAADPLRQKGEESLRRRPGTCIAVAADGPEVPIAWWDIDLNQEEETK